MSRQKVRKRFSAAKLRSPYRRSQLSLRVDYSATRGLLFNMPHRVDAAVEEIVGGADTSPITDAADAIERIEASNMRGTTLRFFPMPKTLSSDNWSRAVSASECDEIRKT